MTRSMPPPQKKARQSGTNWNLFSTNVRRIFYSFDMDGRTALIKYVEAASTLESSDDTARFA